MYSNVQQLVRFLAELHFRIRVDEEFELLESDYKFH